MAEFLKRYSTIPNAFIDDLFGMYGPSTLQTDFVIDIEMVTKWLDVKKGTLMATLKASYKQRIDFVVVSTSNEGQHGGQNRKRIMLTPDCFKRLCMQSRSKKAENMRSYFIAIEGLVMKYRDQMMAGVQADVERLERNQKSPSARAESGTAGYIYVLRASTERDSIYKLGRTRDLARRLREHNASRADDAIVIYTFRTENVDAVETCVKAFLKQKQYRKYKEVYQADVDIIKRLIDGCDALGSIKLHARQRGGDNPRYAGGHYIAIIKDAAPDAQK